MTSDWRVVVRTVTTKGGYIPILGGELMILATGIRQLYTAGLVGVLEFLGCLVAAAGGVALLVLLVEDPADVESMSAGSGHDD